MRVDLHIHSIYSDGVYTPEEVCRIAKSRGLSLISITDHDTLAGLEHKREAAKKHGISYLSGWEVSAYAGTYKVHILGYGCKTEGAYEAFVAARKTASIERAKDSVEKFRAHGVPVLLEEVLAKRASPDLPVHTMHIARAAADHLGISDGEVYKQFLARGKPANSNVGRPTPKQAIDCIHEAGGLAVIAHPGRIELGKAEREEVIRTLAGYGVDGIETVYTTHTDEDAEYFRNIGKELNLLITGGSDTHCESETHSIGTPAFTPSKALLDALKISF